MRSLLDIDVVIALLDPDHVHHGRAKQWLHQQAAAGWASTPLTQNGCARIMSQPRYPNPLPTSAVMDRLATAVAHPAHEFWPADLPGCRNFAAGFHLHHIRFRSLGGGDEDDNLLLVCSACHARVIHAGFARITGRVSEGLLFELGLRPGSPPLSVWSGERRASRSLRGRALRRS